MIVVSDGAMSNLEVGMVQRKLYRAIKPLVPVPGLMRVPCGVCPVGTFFSLLLFQMLLGYNFIGCLVTFTWVR